MRNYALDIAAKNLRSCYTPDGIIAGPHHFTDYWARDGYFACLGSLALRDNEIVTNMVNLFFSYQRSDGLLPYRIMRGPITLSKYLGHPSLFKIPQPTYLLRGFANPVLDGTTLTILFSVLSKNFNKHQLKIERALSFLQTREKNGLLWDGVMSEWNDTALKFGHLLYSNIIYWYMYDRLSKYDKIYKQKALQISKNLRTQLWNGRYFADWYDYKRQDYLYPFANCLAIAWGFTTPDESQSIIYECQKVLNTFTLETNFPKYPLWRIDPLQQLIGMGDYQNHSLLWWQPSAAYLAALKKMGLNRIADGHVQIMNNKICQDGLIYECYQRSGQPFHRCFYTSEAPFAWSAGMIIWSQMK